MTSTFHKIRTRKLCIYTFNGWFSDQIYKRAFGLQQNSQCCSMVKFIYAIYLVPCNVLVVLNCNSEAESSVECKSTENIRLCLGGRIHIYQKDSMDSSNYFITMLCICIRAPKYPNKHNGLEREIEIDSKPNPSLRNWLSTRIDDFKEF